MEKTPPPVEKTRSQVSVFDRLSNPKDSSDALKPKDVPSKKISKTLPTKSLDNTADPFNDIKNLLAKAERSSKGASPPSACKESLKRMIDTGIPESKKLKEASVDNLDDFGLEFEDMDYNDADSNLLELDFEQELTEL
ncbi:hypothetical protein L0F63_001435 [Massospora cicadina]|nr:hypothetical protein L0F63_001435 [Massospora cicadina]